MIILQIIQRGALDNSGHLSNILFGVQALDQRGAEFIRQTARHDQLDAGFYFFTVYGSAAEFFVLRFPSKFHTEVNPDGILPVKVVFNPLAEPSRGN